MRAGRFHSALLVVALLAGTASAQTIGRTAPSEPEFGERLYPIKFARFHLYRMFHYFAQSLAVEEVPPVTPTPKPVEQRSAVAFPPKPRTVWPPIALAMLQQSTKRVDPVAAVVWIAPPAEPTPAVAAPPKETAPPRLLPPPLEEVQWTTPASPKK